MIRKRIQVEALFFTVRGATVLKTAMKFSGMSRLEEMEGFSEKGLLCIRTCGVKTLAEIKTALESVGVRLTEDTLNASICSPDWHRLYHDECTKQRRERGANGQRQ